MFLAVTIVILVAKECYEEYKAVRSIFSGNSNCLRKQIYSSFKLNSYTGNMKEDISVWNHWYYGTMEPLVL